MNTQAAKIKANASKMLARFSIKQLCENWEETNKQDVTIELATVRGWLQDEFERRDQINFDAWLDCDDMDKMDHPELFFINK